MGKKLTFDLFKHLLEQKLDNQTQEIKDFLKNSTNLEDSEKLQKLTIDYEKEKEKNVKLVEKCKNVEKYVTRYQDIDEAYEIYQTLSISMKERLKNVFKTDTVYGLIVACADWRNVEGLWEFAKRRIIEKEEVDGEKLVKLFEFLLQAYNLQSNDKKYRLLKPEIGDKFDSDIHSILGTKTDGYVKQVRISGIVDEMSGKIVRKALVEL